MNEEECDCCGFSETDMRRWQFRAEDQRDRADKLQARIAELEKEKAQYVNLHDWLTAENERLQTENAWLQGEMSNANERIAELQAENERLRNALSDIVTATNDGVCESGSSLWYVAREALAPQ